MKRIFRHQLSRFVLANFQAWKTVAQHQHRLRSWAMDSWRGYSRMITLPPFQAWADFVRSLKNHQLEQGRIVNAYLRWKWRRKIEVILRRWRHQALYGRIDGLYSRQMLIKSLAEQKILTNTLEKMMIAQTVELEEGRLVAQREVAKRQSVELALQQCRSDVDRARMMTHHLKQEWKRLEGIVESLGKLNPRQLAHLQQLQPHFRFKDRFIHVDAEMDEEYSNALDEGGEKTNNGTSVPPSPSRPSTSLEGAEDWMSFNRTGLQSPDENNNGFVNFFQNTNDDNESKVSLGSLAGDNGESGNGSSSSVKSSTDIPSDFTSIPLTAIAPPASNPPLVVNQVQSHQVQSNPILTDSAQATLESKAIATTASAPVVTISSNSTSESSSPTKPPIVSSSGTPCRNPLPELTTTSTTSTTSFVEPRSFVEGDLGAAPLSQEDLILLDRVKWLVRQFAAASRPPPPKDEVEFTPFVEPLPKRKKKTGEGGEEEEEEEDASSPKAGQGPPSFQSFAEEEKARSLEGGGTEVKPPSQRVQPLVEIRPPLLPQYSLDTKNDFVPLQNRVNIAGMGPNAVGANSTFNGASSASTAPVSSTAPLAVTPANLAKLDANNKETKLDAPPGSPSDPSHAVFYDLVKGGPKASVQLSMLNPYQPQVIVNIRGKNKEVKEQAFRAAVSSAVQATLGAIQQNFVSRQLLLATDFVGLGSDFVAAKMLLSILDFLQHGRSSYSIILLF